MSLLTCKDLAFTYDGRVVLSKISFSIEKGDYLCIVGENGAGKSTLMKGLLGLKQPSSGKITLGEGMNPKEIGYLPQQTAAQKDFPASVYEVVLSGCLNKMGHRFRYGKKEKERALQAMERLGIMELKKECYRDLSGGQQQRVLLARALCAAGKLLLLDEPVTGLDPLISSSLYRMIRDLNETDKMTILMVSHDAERAVEEAGQILHLAQKQLFFGSVEDYKESKVGKRFLGREEIA